MGALSNLYATTIGKKVAMAVTGLILFGFVIGHMAGNLLIYFGPEVFNTYAHTLKSSGPLLWGTRLTLLAAFPIHILSAIQLTQINRAARPKGYDKLHTEKSTYSSRTMRFGGIILLAFVLFHLAHYTLHWVDPTYATWMTTIPDVDEPVHDAYKMAVTGFSNPIFVVTYLLAMGTLFMHLDHGAWSMLQTLGANHPKWNNLRRMAARGLATLLMLGFSSVPIAVLLGLVS